MDITNMSVTELKALAYDQLALLEQTQINLKQINMQIAEKLKVEAEKKEEKVAEN